ncbi:hypothetical protein FZEAL_7457 [Fusarium zealandicum]|uniref:Penicillin-binding protein n=1 Tax=Fusarium zealandicum TaxID=1053134 RepID=A0A8H4UGD2_9HYPO|nr:hypothetical protein FZEAL_7457 [Fusarium zealandicum]
MTLKIVEGASSGENPFNDEFEKLTKQTLDECKVPGISIGIIDDDQTYTAATSHLTLEDAISHRTGMPRHDKASSRFLSAEDSVDGEGNEKKKKRYATVKDVTRNLRNLPKNGKDVSMYSLGWSRTLYHGRAMYTHGGGMHAFGRSVMWFPDEKFGVVGFGNTAFTADAVEYVLFYKLIDDKIGIAPEERNDVTGECEKVIKGFKEDYKNAVDIVYHKRPDHPLASPVDIKDLAGKYYDPGYETIELRVEPDPHNVGKEILVADREDTSWKIKSNLQHVSGAYWIMHMCQGGNPLLHREFAQNEFRFGLDGKPTALEVDFVSRLGAEQQEGKVVFIRMD